MKRLIINIVAALFLIIVLICVYAFFIEPNSIEVTTHNVSSMFNIKNTDITFVQITDLHIKSCGGFEENIAEKIKKNNPDFILFTGDIIDDNNNFNNLEAFLSILPQRIKKYAILGNWEYWKNIDIQKLSRLYRKYNCILLINSTAVFSKNRNQIQIIGVDDATAGTPDISRAIGAGGLADNHILITHTPLYRDILMKNKDYNIKLMLSGHSHGGQVRIFDKSPFLPQGVGHYVRGWFKGQYPYLYVSKGLGTSIYPIRIGAKPEIAVFEIKTKRDGKSVN